MMFVDTSAIVAILSEERDGFFARDAIEGAERRMTSPAVRLETCMVLTGRLDVSPLAAQDLFDDLSRRSDVAEMLDR